MSANPLLEVIKNWEIEEGHKITISEFKEFIDDAISFDDNYFRFDELNDGEVYRNHSVTVLYSGSTNGVYNGSIAVDLAERIGDDARVLDNTKIGRLLIDIVNNEGLNGLVEDVSEWFCRKFLIWWQTWLSVDAAIQRVQQIAERLIALLFGIVSFGSYERLQFHPM